MVALCIPLREGKEEVDHRERVKQEGDFEKQEYLRMRNKDGDGRVL